MGQCFRKSEPELQDIIIPQIHDSNSGTSTDLSLSRDVIKLDICAPEITDAPYVQEKKIRPKTISITRNEDSRFVTIKPHQSHQGELE